MTDGVKTLTENFQLALLQLVDEIETQVLESVRREFSAKYILKAREQQDIEADVTQLTEEIENLRFELGNKLDPSEAQDMIEEFGSSLKVEVNW